MFKNHFTTAWRSLSKNKFYSVINISGLAVGLAMATMLLMWIQNELGFDKFNTDYRNIFELSTHFISDANEKVWDGVPGPLAVFAKNIPSIKTTVRVQSEFDQILAGKEGTKIFDGNKIGYVDSGFFSMFQYRFLNGHPATALADIHSIILTQATAQKLFGHDDAVGNVVVFRKTNFTVTGILQNFPENSSLRFDAIFPMAYAGEQFTASGGNSNWKTIDQDLGDFAFMTFVQLQPGTNTEGVSDLLSSAYKKARNGDSNARFLLQNLAEIHLVTPDGNNSSLRMVQLFMLVVVLLLSIASINYVNLSTARSLIRAKEVSIRKIIGAGKKQLFFQFITETALLFCFAITLAIALIVLLMPLYNQVSGKKLVFDIRNVRVWETIGLAVLGTLITAGIYPALQLASFKPMTSLKGTGGAGFGTATLRKGLVVFQFAISIVLLVSTIVMSSQMKYIRQKNLGYDKSYIFSVPLTPEVTDHIEAVRTELQKQPSIENTGASDAYSFANIEGETGDLGWSEKADNENVTITPLCADQGFIPTLKIRFLYGGNFSGTAGDSSKYIINETAAKMMRLAPPYIGQEISLHDKEGTIIGVTEDFNFQSLKKKIKPLIFYTFWHSRNILYVRTTSGHAQQAVRAVQDQYKKYAGNSPFSYHFLDTTFDAEYKTDQRAGVLFNVFAGIAIFISCLGLFGLATYTAQVKFKEIGIRKVLGASTGSIVQLINRDFLKLVISAIVIAVPVAWWAVSKWLDGFAYRIRMSWQPFVLAGLVALFIAFVTVSLQSIKAAIADPVKSLRAV